MKRPKSAPHFALVFEMLIYILYIFETHYYCNNCWCMHVVGCAVCVFLSRWRAEQNPIYIIVMLNLIYDKWCLVCIFNIFFFAFVLLLNCYSSPFILSMCIHYARSPGYMHINTHTCADCDYAYSFSFMYSWVLYGISASNLLHCFVSHLLISLILFSRAFVDVEFLRFIMIIFGGKMLTIHFT